MSLKKNTTKDLEKTDNEQNSWYPLSIIILCIRLIIIAASPLRTASKSLECTFNTLPELKIYTAPSFTTIKRWVQKVGHFKLLRPKTIATDWMVIIDASIQMGNEKCVLALGCREVNLPKDRALRLEDFEVLSVRIVSSLNSNTITEILHQIAFSIGKIYCICSDRGSEIVRGIKDFQVASPKTRHTTDMAHRVANLLEATLEKEERWKNFREQVTQARRKMQNSVVAGALPPSPRVKARYMNYDSMIIWAADMLILLDKAPWNCDINIKELRKYLKWLEDYREEIAYWNKLVLMGAKARDLVRIEGIHINVVDSFEQTFAGLAMGFEESKFADQISSFLSEQTKGVNPGERFIGSTEVLESLFGKLKYMEQEQRAFGFTSLVLAAIACVGPTDEKTVKEAITSTKLSEIDDWARTEISKSLQTQRRSIRKTIRKLTEKTGQDVGGILEREAMGF
jgi:hypothetical protein